MACDSAGAAPVLEVTCPRCGRRTDRVQSVEVPFVLFILVYIAWTYEEVAGCPACVRARLRQMLLFSIPLANVFFPFVSPLHRADVYTVALPEVEAGTVRFLRVPG